MAEGSGHQGLWTEPKYPGDTVRVQMLRRGDTYGEVCIQHYGEKVRVATFTPGNCICLPGDTPKMEPDASSWHVNNFTADAAFDEFIQAAYAAGWQNWERK